MSGHPQEALVWADKALALADQLGGLPEERLRALDSRGVARGDLGDLGGMDDLLRPSHWPGGWRWLRHGGGLQQPDRAPVAQRGPRRGAGMCQEATEFAERRGLGEGPRGSGRRP